MARVRKKREGSMGLRGSLNSSTPEASAVSDERIDHVTYRASDATRRGRKGSHTKTRAEEGVEMVQCPAETSSLPAPRRGSSLGRTSYTASAPLGNTDTSPAPAYRWTHRPTTPVRRDKGEGLSGLNYEINDISSPHRYPGPPNNQRQKGVVSACANGTFD